MAEIEIELTGAIGDTVIATGLVRALRNAGINPVIVAREGISSLLTGIAVTSTSTDPDSTNKVDLSGYLGNQFTYPDAHLVELQAIELISQGGPEIAVAPEDVKIVLSEGELQEAKNAISGISERNGNLPVVLFCPHSTTKNRNLPMGTFVNTIDKLKGIAVCCVMQPDRTGLPESAQNIWPPLREAAALFAAAAAVVSVDSGPLHIANATLQGSAEEIQRLGLNPSREKVIAVLGSSSPASVVYPGNQVVTGETSACHITCRAHGYKGQNIGLKETYSRDFYPSGKEGDRSMCQFSDYPQSQTARCMESIEPSLIAAAVWRAVGNSGIV